MTNRLAFQASIAVASCCFCLVQVVVVHADDAVQRIDPAGIPGCIMLANGPLPAKDIVDHFRRSAGGEKASLAAIAFDKETAAELSALLTVEPAAAVKAFVVGNRESADDAALLESLKVATGVWLAAKLPVAELKELLHDTAAIKELAALQQRGGTLGISGNAIAIALRQAGNPSHPSIDLLPGVVLAPEGAVADDDSWLSEAERNSGLFGLRLDKDAAISIRGREIRSLGSDAAVFQLAAAETRPAKSITLTTGERADYVELRRAALERVEPTFPPAESPIPEVEKGSLVIVGGGGLPDDIARRFVELGGGADGRFVILPTASEPLSPPSGDRFLKRHGAGHVDVLPARSQQEIESPENLRILEQATAIWFDGGRQWRFVDAYEGTKALPLFRDVLRRGGVIGGSSAGATIQGDFLVRGAPAGPHIMMCEGYERGFAFLPGTAIDQHFAQRKRFGDMTSLMAAYPQLLGIGIDEATAMVVTGHVAQIMGKGQVHFYNRRQEVITGEPDHESVPAGREFDLKERKLLESADSK